MTKRKKMTTIEGLMPTTDTGEPKKNTKELRRSASQKASPVVASKAVVPDEPEPKKNGLRPGIIRTSLYLPVQVYKKLHDLAGHETVTTRKKVHDYYLEGIDMLLKSKGLPSIEELTQE